MNGNITVTGMILSAQAIGETDKRVTILTTENGKISAFAKGAKKPTSSLLACTNPFVFGEFELYVGRNSFTVVRANVKNYFEEVTKDIESVYYGSYFLEVADFFTRENNDDKEVLKLLYQTIKALCHPAIDNRLVKMIFEYRMLIINGTYPGCFECRVCGSKEELSGFSFTYDGVVCKECATSVRDYTGLDNSSIYTLQYISNSSIEKLYTFTVSEAVLDEAERIVRRYFKANTDVVFKSEEFLKDILEKPL